MFFTHSVSVLAAVGITCLILLIWKKNSKLPPGPLGLPFFGYYPFISPRPYLDFNNLRKQYGDVMSFRTVGGTLVVVLNGINVIKDVLVNRSEEFIGRTKEHNLLSWISNGLVFASLCLTWLVLDYWKRNSNLPPGPAGLPIFGYYPFLSNQHFIDFAKLAESYGNVFSFKTVGGKLIVVLNGIQTIKDVLVKRSEEFIARPEEKNWAEWISEGLGITQEEGSVWKEHRRFFLQTAKTFGFGKQESEKLIHEEVRTLVKDLKNEKGGPADMKFHVAYAVNSVVCQILFSKKFEKYDGFFHQISDSATYLVEMFADQRYMLVGPIYQYLVMKFFPSTKRIRKSRELFRKIVKEIVDDHVKTFDPENLRDFIDGYLYQAYKLDKSGSDHSFTMKRLHSISFNMLMEGTESVGGTIQGLLEFASQYVDEQKRVQEELDSIVGRERLPSCLDRPKLPYLEAFIQELYRHNMPFNISTHYCNFNETTIQGYRIPRRTLLVANYWTINNDPALYPEPEKFDPRRFIDENGKKIKTEGPYAFGIGKRACIGESLAQMEVFLIIASVMQNFTLYPTNKSGFLKAVPR